MYKDQLATAGLYYEQLAYSGKVLKALNTPKLGDSLLKADGTPWMLDLSKQATKLDWDDLTQTAALPWEAGSRPIPGRQGAHAECQAVCAHECPRQDAV